jgi:hypothetical protein
MKGCSASSGSPEDPDGAADVVASAVDDLIRAFAMLHFGRTVCSSTEFKNSLACVGNRVCA